VTQSPDCPAAADLPSVILADTASYAQRAVFGTLGTARAMRCLKPDPVPREYIEALVWASTRASSPDNTQSWQFVAVTSSSQRRAIATAVAPMQAVAAALAGRVDETETRTQRGASYLARNLAELSLLLFIWAMNGYPPEASQKRFLWSAVYPAAQYVILAARAVGLGAVFSMLHVIVPGQVRAILAIPPGVRIGVMLALGWPELPSGTDAPQAADRGAAL
jgi:nitroreductase